MNLIDFIPQSANSHHPEAMTLYRAYIQCLEPEEVCRLFEINFTNDKSNRLIFLNKIVADMQRQIEGCHIALIDSLLLKFSIVPYRIRQGIGSCLGKVYDPSPEALKRRILDAFLDSPYMMDRNRGYEKLANGWIGDFAAKIEEVWKLHGDVECAVLMIYCFPNNFILKHFETLDQAVWWKPRKTLYMRALALLTFS